MSAVTRVGTVIVPVTDQDRALEFFVGVLGFESRMDAPFGPGERWIEVAPPGAETTPYRRCSRSETPTAIAFAWCRRLTRPRRCKSCSSASRGPPDGRIESALDCGEAPAAG